MGVLEKEILHIIWELNSVTAKDVHERISAIPKRQLAYASVTTILKRLTKKGWLTRYKESRNYRWLALVSQQEAQILQAYEQLQQFLAVGHPDVVAAFADSLEQTSVEQFEEIAQTIQAFRFVKKEK
ncbi:MarR family transcriptional regulator [Scytonema sp. UIC 10036]|uniref:BlaI/MecI/CopY family transcriptional regulator n=1 Tax=Scytonema sp. UIC 10036 TaxID=2304196 RepID=UPI0012DA8BC8|nr:BlaI/MecI/CopY family transcriptional regulator [Scytonema sp. UIC 10036]MUG94497.1 MarR family transcriptional regulator [Scytonema sp. UIC 10036]